MKRAFLPITFSLFLGAAFIANAQKKGGNNQPQQQPNNPNAAATPSATPAPTNIAMWKCTLPAGTYEVAVRAMVSVSQHEFIVAGTARVTEVNIDTMGNTVARFYYIEPLTPSSPIGLGQSTIGKIQDIVTEAGNRVTNGDPPWMKVVKDYPTSTHAHTVEYRLDNLDDLTAIFNSAESAFRLQKNTAYPPSNSVSTSTSPTIGQ
jgi:hypothetical protein